VLLEASVISLPSAHERRERARAQLAGLPLPAHIFDASTALPPAIAYEEERALVCYGRRLQPGELGCFASHYECLRRFVEESPAAYRLILEDDVHLDATFPYARLAELMKACGIDYLRLHALVPRRCRVVGQLWRYRHLVRYLVPPYGTQAYVMSKAGARRFLASFAAVVRPIDDELDRFWHNGLPPYAVHPSPALEMFGTTTIARPETAGHLPGLHRRRSFIANEIAERVRRASANLRLRARDRELSSAIREFAAREG